MNGSEGSSLSATFEILSPRDLMYSVAMSDGLVRIGLESLGWKCGELHTATYRRHSPSTNPDGKDLEHPLEYLLTFVL